MWDITSAQMVQSAVHASGDYSCVRTSHSGLSVVVGTARETTRGFSFLRVHDLRTMAIEFNVQTGQDDIQQASFSPCDIFLLACGIDNRALVFDKRFSKRPLQCLDHDVIVCPDTYHRTGVSASQWITSKIVITGGEDGKVRCSHRFPSFAA